MSSNETTPEEQSLDPADWTATRALGHRMLDDMFDYVETLRDRPVWQPIPADVKAQFDQPLPLEAERLEDIYAQFLRSIMPYQLGNPHPRFWGWVMGNGTITGMLAALLESTVNPNQGGAEHIANYVENQVINWCKEMFGFPEDASGLLVSGGSVANLVGIAVGRTKMASYPVRRQGLQAAPDIMTLYVSEEAHSSVEKAVELLGLGGQYLRKIPVNAAYQIDVPQLEAAIAADRARGYHPFCVVGCAGTTNLGAIDDLTQLADLCAREKLWFHVDGAFGALAALSPALKPLVAGMERADSLAFDMHKWMYLPIEFGCILVRDAAAHLRTFSATPDYLAHHGTRGIASGTLWYGEYGVQLSRRFRALTVWMSLKENGVRKYGQLVEQNVEQARYLAVLVDRTPELERVGPVTLNIVCFRFKADGLDETALNALNEELLIRLQESGIAAPSSTRLHGTYAIRVCITNHRTQRTDLDLLVEETLRLGRELVREEAF